MTDAVFIKKSPELSKFHGVSCGSYYGHRTKSGDIGLEIELEGNRFPKEEEELPSAWGYHEDHSLRGLDNAEYVLNKPVPLDDTTKHLTELWNTLTTYGTVPDVSNRTSVHVHLNFQQSCVNRIAAFTALFFVFEEILSEWCGEHRAGNLFCLRAKDAPSIVSLAKQIVSNNFSVNISDHYHYAGLNLEALQKFGSIEVRHMRGPTKLVEAIEWVEIVKHLYRMSEVFAKDPREICYKYSYDGPLTFFKSILGAEHASVIRRDVPWTDAQIMESMREGIRMAQDICFCLNWSNFEAPIPDPFGRPGKARKSAMISFTNPTSDLQWVETTMNSLAATSPYYNLYPAAEGETYIDEI